MRHLKRVSARHPLSLFSERLQEGDGVKDRKLRCRRRPGGGIESDPRAEARSQSQSQSSYKSKIKATNGPNPASAEAAAGSKKSHDSPALRAFLNYNLFGLPFLCQTPAQASSS